jgi:hypothetical protein
MQAGGGKTGAYLVGLHVCFRDRLQLGGGNGCQEAAKDSVHSPLLKLDRWEKSSLRESRKLKVLLRPRNESFQVRLAYPSNRIDVRCKVVAVRGTARSGQDTNPNTRGHKETKPTGRAVILCQVPTQTAPTINASKNKIK